MRGPWPGSRSSRVRESRSPVLGLVLAEELSHAISLCLTRGHGACLLKVN